jgi:hypothetical protein
MKKKVRLALALAVLMPAGIGSVQGEDLYVYKTNGDKTVVSLEELQTLTFTVDALNVNKTDETTVSIPFTDLRFFSTKDYTFTAIQPVSNESLTAFFNQAAGELTVKNSQPINSVTLLNLQGAKLMKLQTGTTEVTLPLTAYPAGVYLLQIATGNEVIVKKIIKN